MRLFILFFALLASSLTLADRIKDLTTVAGVRSNQLIGYGLVVGLNATGDGGAVPVHRAVFAINTRPAWRQCGWCSL